MCFPRLLVIVFAFLWVEGVEADVTNRLQIQSFAGVTVDAEIGNRVRIEYSPDVDNASGWTILKEVLIDHSPFLVIDDTSPSNGKRFYRSVVLSSAPESAAGLLNKTIYLDDGTKLRFLSTSGDGGIYVAVGTRTEEMGAFNYSRNADGNGNGALISITPAGNNSLSRSYTIEVSTLNNRLTGTYSANQGSVSGSFTQELDEQIERPPYFIYSIIFFDAFGPLAPMEYRVNLYNDAHFEFGNSSLRVFGKFTYSKTETNATLDLNYESGDRDTMLLVFNSGSFGNFTGTTKLGGIISTNFAGAFLVNDAIPGTTTVNAPAVAALQGKTFTFGNGDSLLLSAAGADFTYTPQGGVAQNGTYQYTPAGNTATIVTVTAADGTQTTYNLVFTGAANGQYAGTITRTPQGGNPSASTTFNTSGTNNGGGDGGDTNTNTNTIIAPATITGKNYLVNGGTNGTVTISFPNGTTYAVAAGGTAVETGTYTYTASTTTNTAVIQLNPTTAGVTPNTLNLTFTSVTANAETGTVSESDGVNGSFNQTGSTGINPGGGGTTNAPATLSSIHVTVATSTVLGGGGSPYTVQLTGGTAGTFEITGGNLTGHGTFTYNPSGTTAVLVLNYADLNPGDNDKMTLAFTSSSAGSFTGSQQDTGTVHDDFTGTFDSAH